MKPFTWNEGIVIQTEQMTRFKKMLKPEIYQEFSKLVAEKTEQIHTQLNLKISDKHPAIGYEVPRGTELDCILHNYVNTL